MANKFQKSVLERLEAEEKRRKSAPPLEATLQGVQGNPEKTVTPANPPDIRDYLMHDSQRVAKNKTFYLDAAVVDEVKRISREQKVTESRLVNDILRGVFGL
jgi:hypothetical protein